MSWDMTQRQGRAAGTGTTEGQENQLTHSERPEQAGWSARARRIASAMAAGRDHGPVQLAQTGYRIALADSWQIPAGATVLEIGCGQGDMTAVLADAVGPDGRVVAVDIADPSYGSPVTVGGSAAFLRASPWGQRIDMRFGVDVLDPSVTFPEDTFDHVVMAHCSWYFDTPEQLSRTLARLRLWAPRLCYAEWDLRPDSPAQDAHLLAVLIQGQLHAMGWGSESNVRTPVSRAYLTEVLAATGWRPTAEQTLDTSLLQDADWEVTASLDLVAARGRHSAAGDPPQVLLRGQADALRSLARSRDNRFRGNTPLPAYSLSARRTGPAERRQPK